MSHEFNHESEIDYGKLSEKLLRLKSTRRDLLRMTAGVGLLGVTAGVPSFVDFKKNEDKIKRKGKEFESQNPRPVSVTDAKAAKDTLENTSRRIYPEVHNGYPDFTRTRETLNSEEVLRAEEIAKKVGPYEAEKDQYTGRHRSSFPFGWTRHDRDAGGIIIGGIMTIFGVVNFAVSWIKDRGQIRELEKILK